MSLESWMAEFYSDDPETFKDMSAIETTEHSLKKWIGLRKENLDKHGLAKNSWRKGKLYEVPKVEHKPEFDAPEFDVDASSCALCIRSREIYRNSENAEEAHSYCVYCPLYKRLGDACDEYPVKIGDKIESIYKHFIDFSNPEPMIEALQGTLEMLRREPNESENAI